MVRRSRTFVMQIKGDFRCPGTIVRNQEQFLTELVFPLAAKFFNRVGGRFPAAQAITRIAAPQTQSGRTQQLGIECERTHQKSDSESSASGIPEPVVLVKTIAPEVHRQESETDKAKRIPVRRGHLVNRDNQIK